MPDHHGTSAHYMGPGVSAFQKHQTEHVCIVENPDGIWLSVIGNNVGTELLITEAGVWARHEWQGGETLFISWDQLDELRKRLPQPAARP